MNNSMTRLIKPLITCICAHYRQTNQICSKLFFLNQSKHIYIFIQELCIYKTITFYDSSLVKKKIAHFFFSFYFPSHPVAYSRPSLPKLYHRNRAHSLLESWSVYCIIQLFYLMQIQVACK